MSSRLASVSPWVGGTVWLAAVAWLRPSLFEGNWTVALLLLSPLVLVPLGLRLAWCFEPADAATLLLWLAARLQLPTALAFAIAFALPEGALAALLTLPWLGTTAVIAAAGIARMWGRPSRRPEALCRDAGLVYLVVGGGWAVLARWGVRPLGFEGIIVLLTAVHFHHAGFVLPLVTGWAGQAVGGRQARVATTGVVSGVPLVAAGITATQLGLGPWLECMAACWTALAGLLAAGLLSRLSVQPVWPVGVRILWLVAAVSLAGSMVLAALYGCRFQAPMSWLDIPWMRALHGTTNALGFGLGGLLAWVLARGTTRLA